MIQPPPAPSAVLKNRITMGLTAAVLLWGVYLAVGAALFNRDIRKGVIVLACTVMFLTLWASAMWVRRIRQPGPASADQPWNVPCLLSLMAGVCAAAGVLLVILGGVRPDDLATFRSAVVSSQIAAAVAAILAIVGLSDRRRRRGKWLGLIGLLLVAVTFAAGFWIPPGGFLG